jgi:hypothetical protein
MAPLWLSVLGWAATGTAATSAGWIGFDVLVRRRHQHMRIMEVVWPVTALYFGPLGIWGYRRFDLPASIGWSDEHPSGAPRAQPTWAGVATDVSHCGAGCTLGDLIAEWCVFGIGATIAGLALLPEYIGDYLAALTLGIAFQYFAIAPMRGLGPRKRLVEAAKADILSLTAFEIGLFGLMALVQLVLFPHPHLAVDSSAYWFLMQIGMVLGCFTSWPANVWLIRKGIKEPM